MSDWKERLKNELEARNDELKKLELFINSDEFHDLEFEDQQLLIIQRSIMEAFVSVLGNRYYRSTLK